MITHNGAGLPQTFSAGGNIKRAPAFPRPPATLPTGVGVIRTPGDADAYPQLAVLLGNLICGNRSGELNGALLDSTDLGNLTPTGQEGSGVSRSPGCDNLALVFTALAGPDGQPNTPVDDFTLAANSPAIDHGVDLRTLKFGVSLNPLFEADLLREAARPRDGHARGTAAFDMGALEKPGVCEPGATGNCYNGPPKTLGVGLCKAGIRACTAIGDLGLCVGAVLPTTDILNNGIDEDCDGHDDVCVTGATHACYTGPTGTEGVGICRGGTKTCDPTGLFGPCIGEILPAAEIPDNGIDEDCNGTDHTKSGQEVLPDLKTIAPPVVQGVATTINAATEFLYSGAHPVQTGVAPGTIDPKRIAVLRGKVLDKNSAPLSGVTITILSHPEFGQTLSRADGMFDMAVNGGGLLTVNYVKAGFLSAQRQTQTPWQNYAWLPDVALLALDAKVTSIDLTSQNLSVARGSAVTDGDGARQATLLVPAGTTAQVVMPDGTTQPITTLNVRATEYTVGPDGPKAMPGDLPPTSGYTYAVEYSVDQALAVGAKSVTFSQPLFHYVENFLGFPVGMIVPTGYYDHSKGLWLPSDNGRVVKIASISGGLATLTGLTADDPTVSDAERQQLAQLYAVGQELWRVPITHFTPSDCNFPYGPPTDAKPPDTGSPITDPKPDCVAKQHGSIIGCQDQTLGQEINITGVPFAIHYASDQVPGRVPSRMLSIPLSGPTLPPGLKRIDLEIAVAGQKFTNSFPATPNQSTIFTWDSTDAYGRTVQGGQPVTVRVGYVYDGVYYQPAQRQQSFAAFSGIPITGDRTRREVTLWREFQETLGSTIDQRSLGVGGWSFTVHHAYDPVGKVLNLGDGTQRSTENMNGGQIIATVAGNGTSGLSGDGGPATQAALDNAFEIAIGSDGSLYIAETSASRVRRVGLDGIITTMAGGGSQLGDGGPATQARLRSPHGVVSGSDGSLYIADYENARIRRVGPDGIITVAGNGISGLSGDGGPATQAKISGPFGQQTTLTVDANGYLASVSNPAGETMRFTYTADGLMKTMQDPKNNLHQFFYDPTGRLTKDADPVGGFTALSRPELGNAGFTDGSTGQSYQVDKTTALNL